MINNEAYEWLKKWVDEGTWLYGEGAGVWGLHLSQPTHGSMGFIEFRNNMKKLLDSAERGQKILDSFQEALVNLNAIAQPDQ